MPNAIVVLNAGSSSIKFSLYLHRGETLEPDVVGHIEGLYTGARFVSKAPDGTVKAEKSWPAGFELGHDGALDHLVGHLRSELVDDRLVGIGHRVVHGGQAYTQPVRVDKEVLSQLEAFIPLAPLHQPHNLAPIRRALERAPELPQVACFDTSFHRGQPDVAQMFALPAELREAGIMRYGFHGLSYEYIASVLPDIDSKAAEGRTVVLHLGNGASMCALQAGRSVASTMGFTAVEGLPMGTRSGSLDPGVILYLMDQCGMDARAVEKLIYSQSGLLGVSGFSSDMRVLLASEKLQAKLAVDLFLYRIRRELGSLVAALGGLDAIVFTAGIGENAPAIRSRVCRDAAWLGVEIDEAANAEGRHRISTDASRVAVWVIPTNEELMIARHTRRVLESTEGGHK
ncbi:MAG: acetate/propionate family kinase [Syntrophobacteraceae bacterium]|nr:acetate/propionate family kinase [Syntrophobacteraceae bacterium]